jgi:hypothetical protein
MGPEEVYRTSNRRKLPYNKRPFSKEHIDNLKDKVPSAPTRTTRTRNSKNYRTYNMNGVKLLLYKNRDSMKDIS